METKMINETITPLKKNKIFAEVKETVVTYSGCCGGAPVKDETAGYQLDEEKKPEVETSCGCKTPEVIKAQSSCC